ncbi:ArsR family transcriptional regulator [Streptomyces sp. RY43-2]|uniref:ArsR family transcriptional regulator n=1 Tax=Streptomyces macrolidinus TaxID=2952607 RepID=A0ABT0ZB97_9ACTN|nr:ArsR family transcriptional regulator [Streptomyces macrolidinus]MCN9241040.1 ArsR family transcriptional regulator [Streptomyces macrolidinus]
MGGVSEPRIGWTFLTNHARVLVTIAEGRRTRIRDIAAHCRLTERAVQKIISDLEQGGYLTHTRVGRVNTYRIQPDTYLRHPAEEGLTVSDLLTLLAHRDAQPNHRDAQPNHRDAQPNHRDAQPGHRPAQG